MVRPAVVRFDGCKGGRPSARRDAKTQSEAQTGLETPIFTPAEHVKWLFSSTFPDFSNIRCVFINFSGYVKMSLPKRLVFIHISGYTSIFRGPPFFAPFCNKKSFIFNKM
jgi:hypothetical protein